MSGLLREDFLTHTVIVYYSKCPSQTSTMVRRDRRTCLSTPHPSWPLTTFSPAVVVNSRSANIKHMSSKIAYEFDVVVGYEFTPSGMNECM